MAVRILLLSEDNFTQDWYLLVIIKESPLLADRTPAIMPRLTIPEAGKPAPHKPAVNFSVSA
jgi:hypothetical protein